MRPPRRSLMSVPMTTTGRSRFSRRERTSRPPPGDPLAVTSTRSGRDAIPMPALSERRHAMHGLPTRLDRRWARARRDDIATVRERTPDDRLLHGDLEPGDDARVASFGEQPRLGVAGRHPGVSVLRIGDDVGEAAGADGEQVRRLVTRVAERVGAGASLGADDDVAG